MATIDSTATGSTPNRGLTREERKVIFASSLGTCLLYTSDAADE